VLVMVGFTASVACEEGGRVCPAGGFVVITGTGVVPAAPGSEQAIIPTTSAKIPVNILIETFVSCINNLSK
jgi:hypothetical protein